MKLFNIALLAASVLAQEELGPRKEVTVFCDEDLNDFYKTDSNVVTWTKKVKKEHANPDKPKKQAHHRQVVRIKCNNAAGRRPGNKPGGYPETKASPIVKCVPKGPAGSMKLKPNNRRAKTGADSKPLQYQKNMCN